MRKFTGTLFILFFSIGWVFPTLVLSDETPQNATSVASETAVVLQEFSQPREVVEAFIKAGEKGDLNVLSSCFSEKAPREFQNLRQKTAGKKDLEGLAQFVTGAQVLGETKTENPNLAIVEVKFPSRSEKISVEKTAQGWKILDF